MPFFLSAGSWMASCTNTPSGLPNAMMYSASSWFCGATTAYSTKVVMTMTLFATGAMDDQR